MTRLPWHENVTAETVERDRRMIASTTSAAVLDRFATHPSQWVRRDVAEHKHLSRATMKVLVGDHHHDILRALVLRRDLPPTLRRKLFAYSFHDDRLAKVIAGASTTPSTQLVEIIKEAGEEDSFSAVTIELALHNPNLDGNALSAKAWERARDSVERELAEDGGDCEDENGADGFIVTYTP